MIATDQTREQAVQRTKEHFFDVATGRLRLNLEPEEVDEYIQEEYRRMLVLEGLDH